MFFCLSVNKEILIFFIHTQICSWNHPVMSNEGKVSLFIGMEFIPDEQSTDNKSLNTEHHYISFLLEVSVLKLVCDLSCNISLVQWSRYMYMTILPGSMKSTLPHALDLSRKLKLNSYNTLMANLVSTHTSTLLSIYYISIYIHYSPRLSSHNSPRLFTSSLDQP